MILSLLDELMNELSAGCNPSLAAVCLLTVCLFSISTIRWRPKPLRSAIYPTFYSSIHLSIKILSLYLYLSFYLCLSVCFSLSLSLPTYLPIYLSIYISIYLRINLSLYLPIYLSIYLSLLEYPLLALLSRNWICEIRRDIL